MTIFWSVLGFIVIMGIIVTIHEWGHYQVARWFNIKVVRFSIGFGKPIYRKQGKETEFVIAQIPLGGYVKFADEREEPVAAHEAHRAFNRQSVYKKIAVVLAGPMVNLIFAWMSFTLMFMIGINGFKPFVEQAPESSAVAKALSSENYDIADQAWSIGAINGREVQSWQMVNQELLLALTSAKKAISVRFDNQTDQSIYLPAVSLSDLDINNQKQNWLRDFGLNPSKPKIPARLGQVLEDGPAAKAGLQQGDLIVQIDENAINNWQDFVKVVQASPGKQVMVTYERLGATYELPLRIGIAEADDGIKTGRMGVGVQVSDELMQSFQTKVQYDFLEASEQAVQRSIDLMEMSLIMLKRMILGEVSTQNLSGPISIAQFSGQALQSGIISFISLLGLLSLSIGILNLLPIPVLDGGHLVFYIIEVIKGTPVSDNVMQAGQVLGLMVIIGLTILAVYNDVFRIFYG